MPNYNQVNKYTVTAAGGSINLDVLQSNVTRYVFSGTSTLVAGYSVQATGTPVEGMEFDIRWQAPTTTSGANVVTIFGTTLTTAQALADLIISVYYNGSAWDVDIQQDAIQNIWEVGSVASTAKLVSGGTSTASATGAVNAGTNCTASDLYAFTHGFGCTASNDYTYAGGANCTASSSSAHAEGVDTVASGSASHAEGSTTTASGGNSHAEGSSTVASSIASHAEGGNTTASKEYSHAGGYRAIAARYGQFSRSSGKEVELNSTDYKQFSKLTAWIVTSDATGTLLSLAGSDASEPISIPTNSIVYFRGEGVAIQQSGSAGSVGDSASFHFNGCIKNIAGTTALVDTVRWQDNTGAWGASASRTQDAAAATWTMVPTANNGTDTLDITVTGEANKTVYWLCNLEFTEIRYTP